MVKLLLASEADVEAVTKTGGTPLMYAALWNQKECAAVLLKACHCLPLWHGNVTLHLTCHSVADSATLAMAGLGDNIGGRQQLLQLHFFLACYFFIFNHKLFEI